MAHPQALEDCQTGKKTFGSHKSRGWAALNVVTSIDGRLVVYGR